MTDNPNATPSASAPPDARALPQGDNKSSGGVRRVILIAAGALIGFIFLLFLIALALAAFTDVQQSGAVIRLIRDLVIIFLALEGILIILSFSLLILQIARLVNLLNTEVKPILENTQQTVKTAQTTVEFVSANVAQPVLRLSGFLAGTSVLFNNLFGLKKAIQRTVEKDVEARMAADAAQDEPKEADEVAEETDAELAEDTSEGSPS
jgi:hypothetical protein